MSAGVEVRADTTVPLVDLAAQQIEAVKWWPDA